MISPFLIIAILLGMMGAFGLLTLRMADKLKYERPYVVRNVLSIVGAGQLLITLMMAIMFLAIGYANLWEM